MASTPIQTSYALAEDVLAPTCTQDVFESKWCCTASVLQAFVESEASSAWEAIAAILLPASMTALQSIDGLGGQSQGSGAADLRLPLFLMTVNGFQDELGLLADGSQDTFELHSIGNGTCLMALEDPWPENVTSSVSKVSVTCKVPVTPRTTASVFQLAGIPRHGIQWISEHVEC